MTDQENKPENWEEEFEKWFRGDEGLHSDRVKVFIRQILAQEREAQKQELIEKMEKKEKSECPNDIRHDMKRYGAGWYCQRCNYVVPD